MVNDAFANVYNYIIYDCSYIHLCKHLSAETADWILNFCVLNLQLQTIDGIEKDDRLHGFA